ncbi:MAG: hypothetical protein V3V81_07450 [Candidatus Bathyarchaeia archaeon]
MAESLIDKEYQFVPYLSKPKFLKQEVDEILEDMKDGGGCFLELVIKALAEENTKLKAKLIAVDDVLKEWEEMGGMRGQWGIKKIRKAIESKEA